MRAKFILTRGAICFVGLLALTLVAGVVLAEGTFHPGRRLLTVEDTAEARAMAWSSDSELADVALVAGDGAILRAWSIVPSHGNQRAVILLHGLSDNRRGMIGYAKLLLSHGFSVLMPDARAHGSSEGSLATYGLLESEDIHHWIDWLEQSEHPGCIFGFGESMGAAQLLQSLSVERRFCAVAVESPFSNFSEIAYDRVGQFFRTGPWIGRTILRPVVSFAFAYSRWKYKLDFKQLSPESAVATTTVPVLLIHGRNDSNIPVRHSRQIAARNPAVVLWEVPKADHCGAVSAAPQEFGQRLIGWFDRDTRVDRDAANYACSSLASGKRSLHLARAPVKSSSTLASSQFLAMASSLTSR
jgi:pimeloyl-ACP methyl ester carboxylesterase